jgi:hypothetical protein
MRIMTVAFALGTALVLCNLGTFSAAAHARKAKVVREPRAIIRVPVVTDRIDPYRPPVPPVIRYGNQKVYLPPWLLYIHACRDDDLASHPRVFHGLVAPAAPFSFRLDRQAA